MRAHFHIGCALAMVLLLGYVPVYGNKCSLEQMWKYYADGIPMQEIMRICETSDKLSREEAALKIQIYLCDNMLDRVNGFWVPLPDLHARLQPVKKYYQALKDAGFISQWREEQGAYFKIPGGIELERTSKGPDIFPDRMKESGGYYAVMCCTSEPLEVTGIALDPGGVTALIEFTVPIVEGPLTILRAVKGEKDLKIPGQARFRLYDDGWRVIHVELHSGGQW